MGTFPPLNVNDHSTASLKSKFYIILPHPATCRVGWAICMNISGGILHSLDTFGLEEGMMDFTSIFLVIYLMLSTMILLKSHTFLLQIELWIKLNAWSIPKMPPVLLIPSYPGGRLTFLAISWSEFTQSTWPRTQIVAILLHLQPVSPLYYVCLSTLSSSPFSLSEMVFQPSLLFYTISHQ